MFCFGFPHLFPHLGLRVSPQPDKGNLWLKVLSRRANVRSNLSFALELPDGKDSWSVAIFYFK